MTNTNHRYNKELEELYEMVLKSETEFGKIYSSRLDEGIEEISQEEKAFAAFFAKNNLDGFREVFRIIHKNEPDLEEKTRVAWIYWGCKKPQLDSLTFVFREYLKRKEAGFPKAEGKTYWDESLIEKHLGDLLKEQKKSRKKEASKKKSSTPAAR